MEYYKFWLPFILLFICIAFLDRKYGMLRDISNMSVHKPYSWARVQLAWWTLIVLSSFLAIFWDKTGKAPTLNESTVILLGISAVTTATARVIDVADIEKFNSIRHQNQFGKNFILDILSDQTGVSVHRFQTIVFNAVFGMYFITTVIKNLAGDIDCSIYKDSAETLANCTINPIDYIMPAISQNNLILLGLSSATYAALKVTENRTAEIKEQKQEVQNADIEMDGSVG